MKAFKALSLLIAIPFFYRGLIFFGFLFAGAGHGTDYFGAAMLAPFSTFSESGWTLESGTALWVLVGIFLAFREKLTCRIAACVALILHYLGIISLSVQREHWDDVRKVWNTATWEVIVFVMFYFLSQIFLWGLIVQSKRAIPTVSGAESGGQLQ